MYTGSAPFAKWKSPRHSKLSTIVLGVRLRVPNEHTELAKSVKQRLQITP